ncbi:MAG: lipid II flippase MurJ, partial [Xanthomonadales bacterium]|nr:lipid II flippase MurJ [Xanthomonadales bacterium]
YALGLPAFIAVKVLAPGFYARQDTKTPVRIAIIAMVSNMVMNVVFVGALILLAFRGPHMGLAIASSAAAYINAGLLFRGLRRDGVYHPAAGWLRVFVAVFGATLAMAVVLQWQAWSLSEWAAAAAPQRAVRLLVLIAGAMVAYAVVLFAAGLRRKHLEKGAI